MPAISVVVRTYNEEKWVGHCLEKVGQQTVSDIEVVLVDNQSTDKTVAKARNVRPDLTLVEIAKYMPGLALNEGIRASKGEFLVCLSAHCIPTDDMWLETLHSNFSGEDIAGVYGRQLPVESTDPVDKRDLLRTFGPERRVQERDTFFHNANSMLRRDVWEDHPFKEDVTNIEDQIWGNEVINAGYKLVYDPEAAVYHHHGINQGNEMERTRSVVRTMENNPIHPADARPEAGEGGPMDPSDLDVVAFVPIRHKFDETVDTEESLVTETIDTAIDAEYVDDVIVLPDTEEAADSAETWGAMAPYVRPEELSERDVSVTDVFQFGIEQIEDGGRFPDLVVPLEVTHPFRPPGMLDDLVEKLLSNGHDTVVASLPEYRPTWVEEEGNLTRINADTQFRADRRALQTGLVSLGCVTYPKFLREGRRLGDDVGIYEIDNPITGIEIRERDDLEIWKGLREVEALLE